MKDSDFNELREIMIAIRGEMQKLRTAINGDDLGTPGLSHQLRAHAKDDEKNFAELRAQSAVIQTTQSESRIQIARWGGGLALLVFLIGVGATLAATWH